MQVIVDQDHQLIIWWLFARLHWEAAAAQVLQWDFSCAGEAAGQRPSPRSKAEQIPPQIIQSSFLYPTFALGEEMCHDGWQKVLYVT